MLVEIDVPMDAVDQIRETWGRKEYGMRSSFIGPGTHLPYAVMTAVADALPDPPPKPLKAGDRVFTSSGPGTLVAVHMNVGWVLRDGYRQPRTEALSSLAREDS